MKNIKADLALLFVAFSWGTTFVLVKNALESIPTFNFLFVRFILAFIIAFIIFRKRFRKINFLTLKYGVLVGIVLFLGYASQTLGLVYTSASNSGFITGISVILVPVFSAIFYKNRITVPNGIGVVLAFVGLSFLSFKNVTGINIGDLMTLFCAFAFAFYTIFVGVYTKKIDSVVFAIIQIGTVGVLSAIISFIFEDVTLIPKSFDVWAAILITAFFATIGGFLIQSVAQNFISSTRTALILSMEPVFAGVTAFIFLNERLTYIGVFGAILIFVGMLVSEIKIALLFKNNEL